LWRIASCHKAAPALPALQEVLLSGMLAGGSSAGEKGNDPGNEKDQEQDFCNPRGITSDTAKSEYAGNNCDNQKHE
tara:strand:- start:4900 stop:5127 length:228 start_codon:yes stop_codon:yes gene_type:complete